MNARMDTDVGMYKYNGQWGGLDFHPMTTA